MAHICNLSSQEAEAGGSLGIQGQPGLQSKFWDNQSYVKWLAIEEDPDVDPCTYIHTKEANTPLKFPHACVLRCVCMSVCMVYNNNFTGVTNGRSQAPLEASSSLTHFLPISIQWSTVHLYRLVYMWDACGEAWPWHSLFSWLVPFRVEEYILISLCILLMMHIWGWKPLCTYKSLCGFLLYLVSTEGGVCLLWVTVRLFPRVLAVLTSSLHTELFHEHYSTNTS